MKQRDIITTILYFAIIGGLIYVARSEALNTPQWSDRFLQQLRDWKILIPGAWALGIAACALFVRFAGPETRADAGAKWEEYFAKLGHVLLSTFGLVVVGMVCLVGVLFAVDAVLWLIARF
jgi:hypothetical protein